MSILIKSIIFLFFCVYSARCQGLLNIMKNDTNISKFMQLIIASKDLTEYFNNNYLVVFAPSNAAMSSINIENYDKEKLVRSHMYISVENQNPNSGTSISVFGTTTNWIKYLNIQSKTFKYYRAESIDALNVFFMYLAGSTYQVNDAQLVSRDNTSGTQVYHTIDKVFVNYQDIKFMDYLKTNSSLSVSLSMWQEFTKAADFGKFQNISSFKSEMTRLTSTTFATILVPTNEAWNAIDFNALKNNLTNFAAVMSRFYIHTNLMFLTGVATTFNAGFTDANLAPGAVSHDLQVNVQSYSGRVVQANIPLDYGVIHVIDNAFYTPLSIDTYLLQNTKVYLEKMKKFLNASIYLNGSYTIMPIDDITLAKLDGDPNVNMTEILLNSILSGNTKFTEATPTATTLGGLFVKLFSLNNKLYLAARQSVADDTWISIVPVLKLNQVVGTSTVTMLNGVLSSNASTCNSVFQTMNRSKYQELISSTNNNVTLNVGSPYTIFVPNDESLLPFIANSSTLKSPLIKYILQRMIIAERVILRTKPAGSYQAATMNFAAMLEYINMTITGTNVTIQVNEFSRQYNFSRGGFYCYSNSMNDSTRWNLIYPIPFVVMSTSDYSAKFCVAPPCIACHTTCNYLLLIVVSLLMMIRCITTENL